MTVDYNLVDQINDGHLNPVELNQNKIALRSIMK